MGDDVTSSRLYVARDAKVTVVCRSRLRMSGAQPVRRDWRGLVEVTAPTLEPKPPRPLSDAVVVFLSPLLAGSLTAAFAPLEAGLAVGGGLFLVASYVAPVLRRRVLRRRAGQAPHASRAEVRILSEPSERAAFQQAVQVADRIAGTWPALGTLVDPAQGERLLAEALWEISGVLVRRQELTGVLAGLSRPDFAAVSPTDQTARELRTQARATKAALTQVEADLGRRAASLRRAEEAGAHFIREQEMRQAIRAAERTLRDVTPGAPIPDPAADLAEQTQAVLTAYRELTAGLDAGPPSP
jgi:hypothetical protein